MKFTEKFFGVKKTNSPLCIGLDPDPAFFPASVLREKNPILKFCLEIIDATSDLVCGYKLNSAFFEASWGQHFMAEIRGNIRDELITIADVKRGDIGNTARKYAEAFFDNMGFDAVTLSPYMGYDTVEPFASYKEKMSFLVCLSSNPSSRDFEELSLGSGGKVEKLWEVVARRADGWNKESNIGLVVGATKPEAFKRIRDITEMPLLVPGIGKQGGNIRVVIGYGGVVIPTISRSIIYASQDKNFAQAARNKAIEFIEMMK